MGMSASQARYLALVERMNDIEYQGQQINQQRTTLSNQVNALNNSLLDMSVPTPPSTSDFTKVVYSGVSGATEFRLGNVVPEGNVYNVEIKWQKTGHYIEPAGSTAVQPVPQDIMLQEANVSIEKPVGYNKGDTITDEKPASDGDTVMHKCTDEEIQKLTSSSQIYTDDGKGHFISETYDSSKDYPNGIYVMKKVEGDFTPTKDVDSKIGDVYKETTYNTISADQLSSYFIVDDTDKDNIEIHRGTEKDFEPVRNSAGKVTGYRFIAGVDYYLKSTSGKPFHNPDADSDYPAYVNGDSPCLTFKQALDMHLITAETMNNYAEAIVDAYPDKTADDFYIYFTKNESGRNVPHFILQSDVTSGIADVNGDQYASTYDYAANGKYTSSEEKAGCKLTFDADGRITSISIPEVKDNVIVGYREVKLEASSVTDDNAYKDAYANYEYEKHLYDKKQQEINAKTSVIQSQDKSLELKLTRLDNERKAVNTEMEAVKKVIEDNIDKSFKTFNG